MDYVMPYLPDSIKNIPTHMDFDGQKRAERYYQVIILVFAVFGFIWGCTTQMFSQTLYILFVGVFVSSILTLVPWSIYRKQPLKWQPARVENRQSTQQAVTSPSQTQSLQIKNKKKKLKN